MVLVMRANRGRRVCVQAKWKLMHASCIRRQGKYKEALAIYEKIQAEYHDDESASYIATIVEDLASAEAAAAGTSSSRSRSSSSSSQQSAIGASSIRGLLDPGSGKFRMAPAVSLLFKIRFPERDGTAIDPKGF